MLSQREINQLDRFMSLYFAKETFLINPKYKIDHIGQFKAIVTDKVQGIVIFSEGICSNHDVNPFSLLFVEDEINQSKKKLDLYGMVLKQNNKETPPYVYHQFEKDGELGGPLHFIE